MAGLVPGAGWANRGVSRNGKANTGPQCSCCSFLPELLATEAADTTVAAATMPAQDPWFNTEDGDLDSWPEKIPLIDTHTHCHQALASMTPTEITTADSPEPGLQTESDGSGSNTSGPSRSRDVLRVVLAVAESEWDAVVERTRNDQLAIPGFGVHPWQVHETEAGWEERLRSRLLEHPGAMVGELGLCKCARNLIRSFRRISR